MHIPCSCLLHPTYINFNIITYLQIFTIFADFRSTKTRRYLVPQDVWRQPFYIRAFYILILHSILIGIIFSKP
jgi:hypothetical protein